MIKHVVMWTIKGSEEGVDKTATATEIKSRLEALAGKIEGLLSIQVGINTSQTPESFDVCLISEHTSWDALKTYQEHPLHKEAGAFIGTVRKGRAVVDYEF
jgi:hypothetical protein